MIFYYVIFSVNLIGCQGSKIVSYSELLLQKYQDGSDLKDIVFDDGGVGNLDF